MHTDDAPSKNIAKYKDIETLLSLIETFQQENPILDFTNHKSVTQSFRIVAYQQFDYQEQFYKSIISRQLIIYLKLKSRLDIDSQFEKVTRIGLSNFFRYIFFTFAFVNRDQFQKGHNYQGFLNNDFITFFTETFTFSELENFLKLLTIYEPKDFEPLQKLKDEKLQLYETNFFITKPFLYYNGHYHLPHRAILNQTLKHYVYTCLKSALPDAFPEEFGKRMEKYVQLGLKEGFFDYQNESELKRLYDLTKVSDYRVDQDILIECKATELHPRSGVLRLPNILTKELNSSIVKAYQQLLCTAKAIDADREWFGIIVTYREMYLGFGQDAWDEFLQAPLEEFLLEQNLSITILPPQNLFFITIEDWDYIVQIVKDKNATLKEILLKARETNVSSNPGDRLFLMEMVLQKFFKIESLKLSYLEGVFEQYVYPASLND
ncbi:MAG: hypothetical protein ICV66_01985 [Chitinophagaceae bacterium]|nr:hypothetical protein [Chitinophagaceae bacterium]